MDINNPEYDKLNIIVVFTHTDISLTSSYIFTDGTLHP